MFGEQTFAQLRTGLQVHENCLPLTTFPHNRGQSTLQTPVLTAHYKTSQNRKQDIPSLISLVVSEDVKHHVYLGRTRLGSRSLSIH